MGTAAGSNQLRMIAGSFVGMLDSSIIAGSKLFSWECCVSQAVVPCTFAHNVPLVVACVSTIGKYCSPGVKF